MALLDSPLIEPLHRAESRFLQVLLQQFSLIRRGSGSELRVHFDDDTPAIWHAHAKHHLRRAMSSEARARYQQALDEFLVEGRGSHFEFRDPDFVFRYASGGTLPVVNFRGNDYFVFFYRDVHPIGWNLANGSCDRREELLDPFVAAERELREELLIADFTNETRYVFAGDKGKSVDRVEFAVAREFWKRKFPMKDFSTLHEEVLDLEWIDGPDSLSVGIGTEPPRKRQGCFVNINGEDFGIEIDRVARINVSDGAIFCDGEIEGEQLVNSPVGFFEVERFREQLRSGPPFVPDFFFFDTQKFEGSLLDAVVNGQFISDLQPVRSAEEIDFFRSCSEKFALCPVTKRIATRYLGMPPAVPRPSKVRDHVFISYCHRDKRWLDGLMLHLEPHLRDDSYSVWVDTMIDPGQPWFGEIKQALDRARVAVLLVTPGFVASKFIRDEELSVLFKANEQRGLRILWIPVETSSYEEIGLKDFQAVIDPAKSLAAMKPEPRNQAWVQICKHISKVARA
jgi:8-oxo-dGTP pyrophosphatase MutT (NUDIX family)